MQELEKNLILQAIDMRKTSLSISFFAHIFFSKYYNVATNITCLGSLI